MIPMTVILSIARSSYETYAKYHQRLRSIPHAPPMICEDSGTYRPIVPARTKALASNSGMGALSIRIDAYPVTPLIWVIPPLHEAILPDKYIVAHRIVVYDYDLSF